VTYELGPLAVAPRFSELASISMMALRSRTGAGLERRTCIQNYSDTNEEDQLPAVTDLNHLALAVGMGSGVEELVGMGPFFKTGLAGGVFSPTGPRLSSYKRQFFLNEEFTQR